MTNNTVFSLLILLCFWLGIVQGRILSLNPSYDEQFLISDGIDIQYINTQNSSPNVFIGKTETPSMNIACEHQYGFLPCAENGGGYIFQMVMYQGLLIFGEKLIEKGSKIVFSVIGPHKALLIVFRVLTTLPSMWLIVSGVFSSKEIAQSVVSTGVGVYAGVTVFTLTVQWGICVIYGCRELLHQSSQDLIAKDPNHPIGSRVKKTIIELKDNGIETDAKTSYTARIMLGSLIPCVIVELTDIFNTDSAQGRSNVILMALIVSALFLSFYSIQQLRKPETQDRSLDYSKYEIVKAGSLITDDGRPNIQSILTLFKKYDRNGDGLLSKFELEELLKSIKAGEFQSIYGDILEKALKQFKLDTEESRRNGRRKINETEFIRGAKKILDDAIYYIKLNSLEVKDLNDKFDKILWEEGPYSNWDFIRSIIQVIIGICMLTFLGGPLLVSILQLSDAIRLPSVWVSFVVVPWAMNIRAAITAIIPASKKSQKTASLTFSEIYTGVIMNNLAGLTALLTIVYAKGLAWNYTAEMIPILVVVAIIGTLAYSRTTYPVWTGPTAFALYAITVGLFFFAKTKG